MSAPLILVLGGARSGKSAFAEGLAMQHPAPWIYVATAQAFDAEMADKIAEHRQRRNLSMWTTLDAPHNLAHCIRSAGNSAMLVDCLTLWLSNRLLADADLSAECADLAEAFAGRRAPTIAVSNEVGFGIVPDTPLGRKFRDAQGRLNQQIARIAGSAHLIVAGLSVKLK